MVETTVIVEDGNTIIIGGLRQDEVQVTDKGLPILRDIPFLGKLFSNVSKDTTQTEIVILLTPHVISGDENAIDEKIKSIKPKKEYQATWPNEQ